MTTSEQPKAPLLVERDEQDDSIVCLRLNRPRALNSLDGALLRSLDEQLDTLRDDPSCRVLLLTASGDRAFCAGADLKERATMSEQQVAQRIRDYRRIFTKLERFPAPTICLINGFAFGGGLEIALCCDLRLMARETKVGLTELRLGIIPGAGGTQRLARLIGPARAKELIFTAARVDGPRAEELGLVNYAVPREELREKADHLAKDMLLSAPIATAQAKIAIDSGLQCDLQTGLQIEAACYAITIPTEDRIEGLAAFKEGRSPDFQGK